VRLERERKRGKRDSDVRREKEFFFNLIKQQITTVEPAIVEPYM
jgi:hypothetical protein